MNRIQGCEYELLKMLMASGSVLKASLFGISMQKVETRFKIRLNIFIFSQNLKPVNVFILSLAKKPLKRFCFTYVIGIYLDIHNITLKSGYNFQTCLPKDCL